MAPVKIANWNGSHVRIFLTATVASVARSDHGVAPQLIVPLKGKTPAMIRRLLCGLWLANHFAILATGPISYRLGNWPPP